MKVDFEKIVDSAIIVCIHNRTSIHILYPSLYKEWDSVICRLYWRDENSKEHQEAEMLIRNGLATQDIHSFNYDIKKISKVSKDAIKYAAGLLKINKDGLPLE